MSENIEVTYEDQDWVEAYKELAAKLAALPQVEWADLYDEQPYYVEENHPFPAPAVLLEFNANGINEKGDQGLVCDYNIAVYIYYNDIRDTHHGSWNQSGALQFGALAKAVHRALHGKHGENYSRMTKVDQKRMPAPHAGGRLLQLVYRTIITDNSAVVSYETDLGDPKDFTIEKGGIPAPVGDATPVYGDLGFD